MLSSLAGRPKSRLLSIHEYKAEMVLRHSPLRAVLANLIHGDRADAEQQHQHQHQHQHQRMNRLNRAAPGVANDQMLDQCRDPWQSAYAPGYLSQVMILAPKTADADAR
jgi:hypothetical protein